MEYWKVGILERWVKKEGVYLNVIFIRQTHYSTIPLFNPGRSPSFLLICPASSLVNAAHYAQVAAWLLTTPVRASTTGHPAVLNPPEADKLPKTSACRWYHGQLLP